MVSKNYLNLIKIGEAVFEKISPFYFLGQPGRPIECAYSMGTDL
jgi:hypothetical protein